MERDISGLLACVFCLLLLFAHYQTERGAMKESHLIFFIIILNINLGGAVDDPYTSSSGGGLIKGKLFGRLVDKHSS